MKNGPSSNSSLVCILLFLGGVIASRGLLYATQDVQMDFFSYFEVFRMVIKGASPYFNTDEHYTRFYPHLVSTMFRYPPAFFILSVLAFVSYANAKLLWMLILLASIALQLVLVYRAYGIKASLFLGVLMMSFPVEFNLQRGQIDLLLAACITVFVVYFLKDKKPLLAATALAVAISIKFVPLIFGIPYLFKKDYRAFFRLIAITLIISISATAVMSIVCPRIVPDFLSRLRIGETEQLRPGKHESVQDLVINNWLKLDGREWRYSMNYFGSYMGLSVNRFATYALNRFVRHGIHDYIVAMIIMILGLSCIWIMSRGYVVEVLLIRLLFAYCILNPVSWGTSLVFIFAGLVVIYERYQPFLQENGILILLRKPSISLFWLLTLYILSPRFAPWEFHSVSEALRCISIGLLVVLVPKAMLVHPSQTT